MKILYKYFPPHEERSDLLLHRIFYDIQKSDVRSKLKKLAEVVNCENEEGVIIIPTLRSGDDFVIIGFSDEFQTELSRQLLLDDESVS